MDISKKISQNNWQLLTSFLPKDWESLAKTTGAIPRKLYCSDSASSLLRSLLLHIAKGYSLKETSARLKTFGINISDVGILDALRRSEIWLQQLCYKLYFEQEGFALPNQDLGNRKVRLIDGTIVKEPGRTGSQWRINYSVTMPEFRCGNFDLVSAKGKGNGETIRRYEISDNECVIADRGYSRIADIFYVKERRSDIIVRVSPKMLTFYKEEENGDDKKLNLQSELQDLKKVGDIKDYSVYIKNDQNQKIYGKICAIRKSTEATNQTIKNIKQKASRQQLYPSREVLELAKYTIIFTTLTKIDNKTILNWYKVRWQIELAFKRLKSLAGLGHLPKYSDKSSRAWLYGKLLISLLTEKIMRISKTISPWGFEV